MSSGEVVPILSLELPEGTKPKGYLDETSESSVAEELKFQYVSCTERGDAE